MEATVTNEVYRNPTCLGSGRGFFNRSKNEERPEARTLIAPGHRAVSRTSDTPAGHSSIYNSSSEPPAGSRSASVSSDSTSNGGIGCIPFFGLLVRFRGAGAGSDRLSILCVGCFTGAGTEQGLACQLPAMISQYPVGMETASATRSFARTSALDSPKYSA
jgi:hypothetical protein